MDHAGRYIVIPRIQVEHANALQTWWIIAPPSPMTIQGLVRAMGLRLGHHFEAFAVVHHSVQWLASEGDPSGRSVHAADAPDEWVAMFWNRTLALQQPQGASYIDRDDHIDGGISKGLQPTARCHVTLSLVLEAPPDSALTDFEIARFLRTARLAGGSIIAHGAIRFADSRAEALALLRHGFFLVDRADLVAMRMARAATPIDGLEALLELLVARDSDPDVTPEPWLSANVVGYTTLEAPRQRAGVRQGAPHAYAEALVGLVQYQPARHAGVLPLWRYAVDDQRRAYLVRSA